MGSADRLLLRWNNFESNIKSGFSELRNDEELYDVTIAVGSKQIKAHKVILCTCSPFFRSIIRSIPHTHPLLYLRGIQFHYLEALLSFIYNGEVNVLQNELNSFLALAEELKIKGLTQYSTSDPLREEDEGPTPDKRSRSSLANSQAKILETSSLLPSTLSHKFREDSLEDTQHSNNASDVMEDDEGTFIKSERDFLSPEDPIGIHFDLEDNFYDDSDFVTEDVDYVNGEDSLADTSPSNQPGVSFSLRDNQMQVSLMSKGTSMRGEASSVFENWTPVRKNSNKNLEIWAMFDISPDGTRYRCAACWKYLKAHSSPSNVKHHLEACRQGAFYQVDDKAGYTESARRGDFLADRV